MAEDKLIALILTAGSVVPFVVGALVVRQSLYAPEKGFFYVRGFRIERKDGPTYFKTMMYLNLAFGIFFVAIGLVCLSAQGQMSSLGQKRPFRLGQPYGCFAP